MSAPRNQWGISLEHGWYEWEETRLNRVARQSRDVPDAKSSDDVLLVDRMGRPLIVRRPHPLGFRRP